MNHNRFDPKAAQQQSAFSELQGLRKRAQTAETELAALRGKADAKEKGITLKEFEAQRAVLRNLLVAVENQFLSTKGSSRRIPKDIEAAMKEAQKFVRPSLGQGSISFVYGGDPTPEQVQEIKKQFNASIETVDSRSTPG